LATFGLWVFAAPSSALLFPPGVETIHAFDDSYFVLKNRQKFINFRGYHSIDDENLTDPDDLVYSIVSGPSHGTLTAVPNRSEGYQYIYIPTADYTGNDSITFKVKPDPLSLTSDTGVISITVGDTYLSPYGIKAPDFGITESHTMYEDTETYQYDYGSGDEDYRVDATYGPYTHWIDLGNGDDTDNPFGTPGNPRATIPTSDLPPGSVVVIISDDDDDSFSTSPRVFSVDGGGSSSLPVFIRGRSASNKATLKQRMDIESSYIIVENIDFDAGDASGSLQGAWFYVHEKDNGQDPWEFPHHVAIRHCSLRDLPEPDLSNNISNGQSIIFGVRHPSGGAEGPGDTDEEFIENCLAYDVEVWAFGNWESDSSGDEGGVAFEGNAKHGWVLDSNVHHVQSSASGGSRNNALPQHAPAQHIYFGRNFLHHAKEGGVQIKHGRNAIISQNKLYRFRRRSSNLGGGVTLFNQDANSTWPFSDNVWVLFNEIYDSHRGITSSLACIDHPTCEASPDNHNARLYVIGNVIHHIEPFDAGTPSNDGFALLQSKFAQGWYVNNTISKFRRAFHILSIDSSNLTEISTTRAEFINNSTTYPVVDTSGGGDPEYHVNVATGEMLPLMFEFDFNHHYDNLEFRLPGGAGTNIITSMTELRNETQFGHSSIEDAAPFVSVVGLDFSLATPAGDNLTDSGRAHFIYNYFTNIFGAGFPSIKHDIEGNAIGDPDWPIGAYSQ
jgi:hypothetical protein